MGRKRIVEGTTGADVHTVYMGNQDWIDIEKIAEAEGKKRSSFIRDVLAPYLAKYRKGEIIVPAFDINKKTEELDIVNKIESEKRKQLLIKRLDPKGKKTDYAICRELVANGNFKAGKDLEGDVAGASQRLKTWDISKLPIDDSARIPFCIFLDAVARRRVLEREITDYWKSQSN